MTISYTLLENGLEFIVTALEYLDDSNDMQSERIVKHSLVNLSSGIELIFKQRLFTENWTYIFADMNKAKEELLRTGELRSVDSETNEKRLKELCGISFTAEERTILKSLRDKRNKIDHFQISDTIEAVKSITIQAMNIVFNFLNEQLDQTSFSKKADSMLLEIKEKVMKVDRFVGLRLENIVTKEAGRNNGRLDFISCPSCLQPTLNYGASVKCLFCYYHESSKEAATDYITNVLGLDAYSTIKHGGEYPLYECFECNCETMVHDCENDRWICFNCGTEFNICDINFCTCCGHAYVMNKDDDFGLCSECIDYKMSAD